MHTHICALIKISYTGATGKLVETPMFKVSKTLNIGVSTLKELSRGGTPQLKPHIPQDMKVTRIQTVPKPPSEPKKPDGTWYCDLCKRSMKFKSKYEHVQTIGHKKKHIFNRHQSYTLKLIT